MAPERPEPRRILRPARAEDEDVRSLDEASRRRRRSPQTCRRTARIAPEREGSAAQGDAQPRRRFGARTDMRSRAVQAFWAMHVEALNWSGMSTGEYANALLLSPWALRKWRARFDDGEVAIDWRAPLSPSPPPPPSTRTSRSNNEPPRRNPLHTAVE